MTLIQHDQYIMHADWNNYLQTLTFSPQTSNNQALLAPLSHLAVLSVTGTDAASFLQGQVTCNINTLLDSTPILGAFCNAKGRTISTFIIIKQQESLHLILTSELLDKVRKKLSMYILRADVQITDQSDQLCIIGIHNKALNTQSNLYQYPEFANSQLFIGTPEQSRLFTDKFLKNQAVTLVDGNIWTGLEIRAGIPWLYQETTEDFVPQMLNLDKLNAISFDKGCYTGQEIVARTHYLGKNKRTLYRANSCVQSTIAPGCIISDSARSETQMGTVINSSSQATGNQLLVVLKDEAIEAKNLQLNNQNHDKISLNTRPDLY